MGIERIAVRFAAGLLTFWLLAAGQPAARSDDAPALPRYHLTSGQEIFYRTVSRSEQKGSEVTYSVDWNVWALGRDADGGWRLVLRCDLTTTSSSPNGHKGEGRVDKFVWQCRMFDDGRLVGATTMGSVRDPFRLFPRLPHDALALEQGWNSEGADKDQVRFHYRPVSKPGSANETFVFSTTSESALDKIYLITRAARSTFDARRGLITRVETEDTSGYGITGTTRGTIELVSVADRGAEWAERFGRDAGSYFAAAEAYESAIQRASRDAIACKSLLADAKAKLEQTRAALTAPAFREAIEERLAQHEQFSSYYAEEAVRREALLGKPAADWEAKNLDGKTNRLADYRGKVVLLDFWYRGCGWCMFAMPQVNRLAEAFRDEPVAVLGMTTDEDENDARVVVDAMGLRYPVFQAKGIPEKYSVQGYPTLIVIDQQGKIRDVHVGYSPRLFEELSGVVRGLLAEKAAD
jgi:thiol-disulfide isomerase/thioredoxin